MSFDACFAQAVLDPQRSPPSHLCAPDPASLERRFAVHRNTFVSGMIESLSASFPVVAALVGPDFFQWMARSYVFARPPTSPLPLEHALGFPDFVGSFEPAAGLEYLHDVARLEAARLRACHARDEPPIDPATLRALTSPPERLWLARVTLHPSTYWLESGYAVWTLWQAHQAGADHVAKAVAAVDVELSEGAIVFRPALEVLTQPLPDGGGVFLAALEASLTLGEAIDSAMRQSRSADPASLLGLLLAGAATHFHDHDYDQDHSNAD
jgi:hypothetical protein